MGFEFALVIGHQCRCYLYQARISNFKLVMHLLINHKLNLELNHALDIEYIVYFKHFFLRIIIPMML